MARASLRWSLNRQERDPEIDVFNRIWQKEHIRESELAVLAGLSASTVANLFSNGKTRRPQHLTYAKMAHAMGFEYKLSRETEAPNYLEELPKAREEYKAYKKALAKRRKQNGKKKK
jgi:transcriptional regulator with XRE-family HTH domain